MEAGGGKPDGGHVLGAFLYRLEETVGALKDRVKEVEASYVDKDELHTAEEKMATLVDRRIEERSVHNRAVIMSDVEKIATKTDERLRELIREEAPSIVDERFQQREQEQLEAEEKEREAKARKIARIRGRFLLATAIIGFLTGAVGLAFAFLDYEGPQAMTEIQQLNKQVDRAAQ